MKVRGNSPGDRDLGKNVRMARFSKKAIVPLCVVVGAWAVDKMNARKKDARHDSLFVIGHDQDTVRFSSWPGFRDAR